MNLIDLKKQQNNKVSNYFFRRDALIKHYTISILKLYDYEEVLNEYNPLNNDKLIKVNFDQIDFTSNHIDLAHAKHQALAIFDYFETKFKKDFCISTIYGVKDGVLLFYVTNSNTYHQLISINFIKSKIGVLLKGKLSLNKGVQDMLEESSFFNIFKPYIISLYPIQLNNKEVLKYGTRIAKKIKQSFIHDTSEIAHSEKAKLSSQLNIPYSVSYGLKDISGSTINIYHHQNQKYNRIELAKLDKELNQINRVKSGKDLTEIIYLCNSSKCRKSSSKLDGILISPFNQIIDKEVCYVCSKRAAEKLINIRVGERI